MRAQVGAVRERAQAVHARERLLPRVSSHVALEQPRARERFPADFTLTRQRVCPYVHLERA